MKFFTSVPFILGHRGVGKGAYLPENTLLAFSTALDPQKHHLDFCECDIRTTNGKGRISGYTFQELSKFDAGKGEKIPLLEDLLLLFEKHNKKLFIEFKEPDCEEDCIAIVDRLGMMEKVNLISFYPDILMKLRILNKDVQIGLLLRDGCGLEEKLQEIKEIEISNIGIAYLTMTKKVVETAKTFGVQTWTWNPRDEGQVHIALDCGCVGMGSDNIEMTKTAVSTWRKN